MKDLIFTFTADHQEVIARYFGKGINKLENYEVCELLDRLIGEQVQLQSY